MNAPLIVRETPANRMQEHGVKTLTTVELMQLVLGSGAAGAEAILTRAGGRLRRIDTVALKSVTKAKRERLLAALELGRRMSLEDIAEGAPIRGPRDVFELMSAKGMQDLPHEEFRCLVLDSQHRLDRDVLVTRGLLNSSLVHPREVFREAIESNAAAIILVHNHPSGDPTPSPDDRITTEQLVQAGRVLDIPVQDHIIIGRGRYLSFAEAGLL